MRRRIELRFKGEGRRRDENEGKGGREEGGGRIEEGKSRLRR